MIRAENLASLSDAVTFILSACNCANCTNYKSRQALMISDNIITVVVYYKGEIYTSASVDPGKIDVSRIKVEPESVYMVTIGKRNVVQWTNTDSEAGKGTNDNIYISINTEYDYNDVGRAFQILIESTPPSPSGCFIATSVYSSPLAPEVLLLQAFRDRFLLTSAFGTKLVNLYYKASPPIAKYLENHRSTANLVKKVILGPFVRMLRGFGLKQKD